MNRIQLAVFPSVLLGILGVIFVASLAKPSVVIMAMPPIATNQPTAPPAEAANQPKAAAVPDSNPRPAVAAASSECSIPTRYPEAVRQWCAMIEKHAKPVGMDPKFVAAIILQESGGNPKAYSKSGAVGLMQVMPRDGLAASFQCNGRPCFSSRPSMAELYDPEYNISYAIRMLIGLYQKSGDLRETLRAYGPMDVGYYYADLVLKIYNSYQ